MNELNGTIMIVVIAFVMVTAWVGLLWVAYQAIRRRH